MKRILIVDDQADLRRLVRWSLELVEEEVEWHDAPTGDAALVHAGRIVPDLVLLDIMTPGELDGLQVCERIRTDPRLAATKVVLLSARGQKADIEAGLARGAHAYVVKPFSPQKLLETVEGLLAATPETST